MLDQKSLESIRFSYNVANKLGHKASFSEKEDYFEKSKLYEYLKRAMDIVGSLVLLILSSPVFPVIAILIKLESRGPIFFTQTRIGENRRRRFNRKNVLHDRRNGLNYKGRPFKIYKFRTMYADTKPYQKSPHSQEDPRITRVGKILRKMCLDELPQLINILKGDMSFVGPRPEMPFWVNQYTWVEEQRLLVKPGLTGLWQLYCPRDRQIHENIEYDLYYIKHRNLWLDLEILLKTVLYVVSIRNI